jgi:hypothetical protein
MFDVVAGCDSASVDLPSGRRRWGSEAGAIPVATPESYSGKRSLLLVDRFGGAATSMASDPILPLLDGRAP